MTTATRLASLAAGAAALAVLLAVAGFANEAWGVELVLLAAALATALPAIVLGVRARAWRTVGLAAVALVPVLLAALWLAALMWAAAHGKLD